MPKKGFYHTPETIKLIGIRTKEGYEKMTVGDKIRWKKNQLKGLRKNSWKISQKLTGIERSQDFINKHIENAKTNPNYGMKGRHHTKNTKIKIKKNTIIGMANMSTEKKRLFKVVNIGKKASEKTKNQQAESMINLLEQYPKIKREYSRHCRKWINSPEGKIFMQTIFLGKKSHFWKGGIAYFPYSAEWNNYLKRKIRERDDCICQNCNKGNSKDVHHIDYNKQNCEEINLITLCRKCHGKTQVNREYWQAFFTKIIKEKYKLISLIFPK